MSEYIDYPKWPQLAREALTQKLDIERKKYVVEDKVLDYTIDFEGYVIAGMGGSGIVGDILSDYLTSLIRKPIVVVKDLEVPRYVDQRYLVLAISYSGNTSETVLCYLECVHRAIPVISLSTGGKLHELSQRFGLPHVTVPKATAPRYALPGLLYAALNVITLFEYNYADRIIRDAKSSIEDIERALEEYERVKGLASNLASKHIVVFVPKPVSSVGLRFKNDVNENAKQLVTVCTLPESEHNDIAAFVLKHDNIATLIIRSNIVENINLNYKKHVEAVKRVLEEYGYAPVEYRLQGSNLLGEVMYGITQLGMLSLDMARSIGVDPVKIEAIDKVKRYVG